MTFRLVSASVLAVAALWGLGCQSAPQGPAPGDIAAAYAAAGRFDEAAREIDLAVRARPRDLALRRQAAQIHRSAGNAERAVGHLETAVQFAPQNGAVWGDLGDLESSRDNVADAYVAYRRASSIEPNDLRAAAGLAKTAQELGFQDEADAAYARWAELEGVVEAEVAR